MKKNTLFFSALICAMLCLSFNIQAQELDFDNDGINNHAECVKISGAASPESDKIEWELNQFKVFTIGANTNGLGYQESGFQEEVYDRGQPLTVLDGASDYSFTQTTAGTATTTLGTFANGTLDFEHNYLYRSYEIHQFRTTTSGGFTSGSGPSNGLYVYPEVGNQSGDYYTVNINFTEPVASFSFDFVDIYDTNSDPAVMNYEVYADGNLIAYFSNAYLGDDATGNIDLYDADGTFKGSVLAGQNIENTIGFVTSNPVSQVSIRHIAISGGLAEATHDPHGLDSFAYSFLCDLESDVDDDNDGILDVDELNCSSGFIDLGQSFSDNTSNPGTINNVYSYGGITIDFIYELLGSANWSGGVSSQTAVGVSGSYINTQPIATDFNNGDVAVYTFDFSEPVYNLSFKLGGFDNQDRADLIATNNGANIPISIVDINLTGGNVSGQSAYDVDGYGANAPLNSVQVSIDGPTDILTITVAKNDGENNHATIQIFDFTYCAPVHSDNDGIPNHLDIDADNDGIPDNVEGQPTNSYLLPSATVNTTGSSLGLWDNYGTGITPEDTDGDGTPDYIDLDSDNDGLPDIEENGMSDVASGSDMDLDGLDNSFETTNINDSNLDINEDIEDPTDLSILPDTDSDLSNGGDLDYRDDIDIFFARAALDFDGVDDYLSGNSLISGLNEVTIMAWIKIDPTNAGNSANTIVGEDIMCRLYVENGNRLRFGTKTTAGYTNVVNGPSIDYDEWHHVTGTFSSGTGTQSIYLDGELITSNTNVNQIGQSFVTTTSWTGNFEVGRLSRNISNQQYYNGEIDEVRVFKEALSTDQIQRIVYQEIENNLGNLKGSVINKDIIDISNNQNISWNNLVGYYPMSNIVSGRTDDYSSNDNTLLLNNITTIQEQTAPMPYETKEDGDWTDENSWLHGNVWDIEDLPNKDWSIVHIKNDIETNGSHTNLGLIIDTGETLKVSGNNLIQNTWYLELDGTLDLEDESQLIQTENSELAVSSAGKILRRQEGLNNVYRYNYWSSPVGAQSTVANNTDFSLNQLKDANGNIQFTGAYTPPATTPATISTYWLYTYKNGVTYYDWSGLNASSNIEAGVGYTQKGTGVGTTDYQYIFEGKPNNGEILIDVNDTGGSGSVPSVSKTEYLLGNPYPSALDAHAFIDDNVGQINGTLYFWEQWAGDSHNLNQYEGGYATLNKVGGVRAYQFVGIDGANTGVQSGTKTPERYIPVAQGFMVEVVGNDDVEFNNAQRVFQTEASGDSMFMRSTTNNDASTDDSALQTMRLEFSTTNNLNRELLLAFGNQTTDGFDYGYDAIATETFDNDLLTVMNNEKYAIQAYSAIQDDKEVDLILKSDATLSYTIRLTETENIETSQDIFLYDNLLGVYHDLRTGDYNFTAQSGEDATRFKIVFQSSESLSNEEFESTDNVSIFVNNTQNLLFVKGLESDIKNLNIINMLGQNVVRFTNIKTNRASTGLEFSNLSTGVYIVDVTLTDGKVLSKKVTIN